MAMRLFAREEFFAELQRHGFKPTNISTGSGRVQVWRTPNDHLITISVHEVYPDYILDKILAEADCLYHPPFRQG